MSNKDKNCKNTENAEHLKINIENWRIVRKQKNRKYIEMRKFIFLKPYKSETKKIVSEKSKGK